MSKVKEAEVSLSKDQEFTEKYFNSNKELHTNFEEFRGNYKISTGSKIFDLAVDGGLQSGLVRFVGPTEGGKTSEALEIQANYLETLENSKGIFVLAEGRLSDKMKERCRSTFVYNPKDWVDGTVLVFECNIYETVFDWLRELVTKHSDKTRYCVIIDSMDGLLPEAALKKSTSDAAKIAAGAVMTGDFLRRTNGYMAKRGHLCIMMGQVRAEIKGQYEAKDKNKLGGASGGNAAVHYPDWVFEFQRPRPTEKILPKGAGEGELTLAKKPIGQLAKVKIWKSTNETSMIVIQYPVKFGRVGKSSVWVEREIVDLLLQWGFFEKKGSWFSSSEELTDSLKLDEPIKLQGIESIYDLLEKDSELTDKLNDFCDKNILNV